MHLKAWFWEGVSRLLSSRLLSKWSLIQTAWRSSALVPPSSQWQRNKWEKKNHFSRLKEEKLLRNGAWHLSLWISIHSFGIAFRTFRVLLKWICLSSKIQFLFQYDQLQCLHCETNSQVKIIHEMAGHYTYSNWHFSTEVQKYRLRG